MNKDEPPSPNGRSAIPFLIGKNSHGNWVVQDPSGRHGGLFVDRVQAVKYAMSENGRNLQAVIMVPWVLELDLNAKPRDGERPCGGSQADGKRAA